MSDSYEKNPLPFSLCIQRRLGWYTLAGGGLAWSSYFTCKIWLNSRLCLQAQLICICIPVVYPYLHTSTSACERRKPKYKHDPEIIGLLRPLALLLVVPTATPFPSIGTQPKHRVLTRSSSTTSNLNSPI
ncbi:hypothetical protein VTJ04DRAFT_1564 [Mycothermus thermophilus]|uniref:uncharacterized protein n=1 Tax=Humicola insolens TaxID=85995 RepID=UPI003744AC93